MVKHTQIIYQQKPMNCLSLFDYSGELALNRLKHIKRETNTVLPEDKTCRLFFSKQFIYS